MINLTYVKQYCQEYWKIENYQEAVNDQSQTWHCHHRHEIEYNLSKIELQALGFYFDRPFCELIFLTPKEHKRLHTEGENHPMYGKEAPNKGKHITKETKTKMSNAMKGNQNGLKYHITAEELYDLYVLQGLSTYKIAKMYGCNSQCIWNKLKKYNIKK